MINSIIEAISIALNAEFGDDFTTYTEKEEQGLKEPCFFISAYFDSISAANKSTVFVEATIEIPFFSSKDSLQRVRNEDEAYKTMGKLSAAFSSKLRVSDRFLNITDNSFSWGGENNDIPTFQFTLEYFDDPEAGTNNEPKIENVIIQEGVEN